MKIIEKIALAIFTVITFVLSLIIILAFCNIISISNISSGIEFVLTQEPNRTIFFGVAVVCLLLDVIILSADENNRKPIITKNEKGILEIMPETIENIALIEVNRYASVQDTITKMKMKKEGIIVNVFCRVLPEVNICDLTRQLQDKIKEKIERQTGAIVNNVNIRIKDIKKPKEMKATKED